MYYLVKKNYVTIKNSEPEPVGSPQGGAKYYQVNDWQNVLSAFNEISTIPFFKKYVDEILSLQIRMRHEREVETIPLEIYTKYQELYNKIVERIESIIEFCESAGFGESQHGFDVKMPPTNDFSEFSDHIKDLEFILRQCPYLNIEGEKIELNKTDSGSIWFEFFVVATGTAILIENLAKIVDRCVKIKSHLITVKQQEEMLRSMGAENDLIETMVKTHRKMTELLVNQCVNDLKNDMGEVKNEEESKLKMSLERLSNMMSQGLEIVTSIDSPKEIKALFPTSEDVVALPSPQKLLGKGGDGKGDENKDVDPA